MLASVERAANTLWCLLQRWPWLGWVLWAAIGFELFGLASSLEGLVSPAHSVIAWIELNWGIGSTASLVLLCLGIRLCSVHLQLNHMRVDRSTGTVSRPPMFSPDRPAMGRATLLGFTAALLDAVLLYLCVGAVVAPPLAERVCSRIMQSGPLTVAVGVILLGLQTALILCVLWGINASLSDAIKQKIPASRPLLQTRAPRNRLLLASAFGLLVYIPIAQAFLLSSSGNASAIWVLSVFLTVQLVTLTATEMISLGLDWWNGQWIQNLGKRLISEPDPKRRLHTVEHMVRFGELAGPVWPELPVALSDTAALGALSARLLHLGVQLAVHVTLGQWAEALGVGETITEWFPDSKLAMIVQERSPYFMERAALP